MDMNRKPSNYAIYRPSLYDHLITLDIEVSDYVFGPRECQICKLILLPGGENLVVRIRSRFQKEKKVINANNLDWSGVCQKYLFLYKPVIYPLHFIVSRVHYPMKSITVNDVSSDWRWPVRSIRWGRFSVVDHHRRHNCFTLFCRLYVCAVCQFDLSYW